VNEAEQKKVVGVETKTKMISRARLTGDYHLRGKPKEPVGVGRSRAIVTTDKFVARRMRFPTIEPRVSGNAMGGEKSKARRHMKGLRSARRQWGENEQ